MASPKMNRDAARHSYPLFIASVAVVFFLMGLGFGFWLSPEYRYSMYEKENMSSWRAGGLVDLKYIDAMIAHHRGAMILSEEARKKGTRDEIRMLAENITKDEPKAIDELYEWKRSWFGDSRTVRDPIVVKLGQSDETFDLRFVNALISHHREGIEMTRAIRLVSNRSEVLDNSDAVEDFLSNGLKMLTEWRTKWYGLS